ncbi:hypothetical protein PV326_014297, partial [Microctonus aethiopoides]
PSALRSILVAATANKTEFARRKLARSGLKQMKENLARDECKACIEHLFVLVDQNTVYKSSAYQLPKNLERFYNESVQITEPEIIELCYDTVAQSFKEMLSPKKFSTESTQYGIVRESCARKEYEAEYSCKVLKVGVLVSFEQPWLRSSFDGVLIQDGVFIKLLEIKCPFECKNKSIIMTPKNAIFCTWNSEMNKWYCEK